MSLSHIFLGAHDPKYKSSGLRVADGYYYKNSTDEFIKQPLDDQSADEGAGAIISSVLDYAKYLRIMMTEAGPLSKDGHSELRTPRSSNAAQNHHL
ncbi:hypothetical protein BKA67DRAFT_584971 [Truncatella angustata]|uniref:Uncharacterized protein n=1 Tax=Truncatella angustata TaxID=152316 RepID=A0A9P8RG68_9PEZI|nr:uncharacterized protein BKA67DRAFT_584971 [Truncatella angustata]KAH6645414.1 hypothetical protein BKA67DRAFT_584971 [Truncatella angustata]